MKRAAVVLMAILASAWAFSPQTEGMAESPRAPAVELFGDQNINNVNITRDCTLVLTGNLTVTGPGYLELSNVTLKMNCSFPGQYRISVVNGGRLALVNNTVVARQGDFNYSFAVSSASQLWINESSVSWCGFWQPALEDWSPGIFVNNSRADLRGALLGPNFAAISAFSSNLTFNRTQVQNNDFGIALNRSWLTLRDSDINSTSPGPDLRLNGSWAEFQNSTCRWGAVAFADPSSMMNVSWPVAARTAFLDDGPSAGVNISFWDRLSVLHATVPTDAQGYAKTFLRELCRNRTATVLDSPYIASSEWQGSSRNSTAPFPVNGSASVFLGIDRILPAIAVTHPATQFVNQSTLVMRGTASDDQAVSVVQVSQDGGASWKPANDTGTGARWASWDCPVALQEGNNNMLVQAVDAAGLSNRTSMVIVMDIVPPSIEVFTPAPGCVTNAGSMVVSGQTEPDSTVMVNDVPAASSAGRFNSTVPLRVGWNSIAIVAVDRAGNTCSTSLDVLRDVSPPNLTLSAPLGDFLTNRSTITVSGHADPDAVVIVGGSAEQLAPGPDGNFSVAVNLSQGPNTIDLRARDRAGNEALVTVKGVMDSIAPLLDAWALVTLTNQSFAVISGKTEPGSNVTVAGTSEAVGPFGDFSGRVDLAQGQNRISVIASDAAGNRNLAVVEVFRDVIPPRLNISRPAERQVLNNTDVEVAGTAEDDNGIAGVNIVVDDRNLTSCNGTTSWKGTVRLSAGNHTIQVIAYDRAGNSQRVHLNVSCNPAVQDTTPPAITVVFPAVSEVSSKNIRLRGIVTDKSGVSRIDISADRASWRPCTLDNGTGAWQADMTLHQGVNTFFLRAYDSLGNNGTRAVDVSFVPAPTHAGPDMGSLALPAVAVLAAAAVALLLFIRMRRWKDQPEPGLGEDEALMGFPGKGFK
jgi:hypothetical protein